MKKITFILFTFSYLSAFGQNNLEKSKNELNSKPEVSSSGTTVSSSSSPSSNTTTDADLSFFVNTIVYVTTGIYYSMFGIYEEEQHLNSSLTPYPYYNKKSGNYEKIDTISKDIPRFSIEDNFLYNSNNLYGN